MEEKRNAYRILVGEPERRRLVGRQEVGGWTTDLREIGINGGLL
jgi:hypothetical protein